MTACSIIDCESGASSVMSLADFSRYLEGESDWTIPVMPKWARSPARETSGNIDKDIKTMVNTRALSLYDDAATARFTLDRLRRAAQQLSPPRFDDECKRQRKEILLKKAAGVKSRAHRAVDTTKASTIVTATKNTSSSAPPMSEPDSQRCKLSEPNAEPQPHISDVDSACNDSTLPEAACSEIQPRDAETASKTIATEEQNIAHQEVLVLREVPIRHMLRKFGKVVEDVQYAIRRNGKVFWWYKNGPSYVPLTLQEFIQFEAVYQAEHFPYHGEYYLAQMYGASASQGHDYLMPLYPDNWEMTEEKRGIVWAEWARYYHRTATNEEMRQQANERAHCEASLLWGPPFSSSSFTPILQHGANSGHTTDNYPHAPVQHEHGVDLEAGAQEIMAILHKTPQSSPSKQKEQVNATTTAHCELPQRCAQQTIKTPSPARSCLKIRSESDSAGTGSGSHNGTNNDQENGIAEGNIEESTNCGIPDPFTTEPQQKEGAKFGGSGLMSPAAIYCSHTQAQKGFNLTEATSESTTTDKAKKDAKHRVIDIPRGQKGKTGTPGEERPCSSNSHNKPKKGEEASDNISNVYNKTSQAMAPEAKTLADSTDGTSQGRTVWSKMVAASPESSKSSSSSTTAPPRGWKTFRKLLESPGSPTRNRTDGGKGGMNSPVRAPKDSSIDLAERIEEPPTSPVTAPGTPVADWAKEVVEAAASPIQATPAPAAPRAPQSPLSPPRRGQGGRTLPAPRAPANSLASVPNPAQARAGQRQDKSAAPARGGQGRQERRGAGSRGGAEDTEGSGGGAGRGVKKETPRWKRLRNESSWR
ncbi:hypothetical protein QBC41DRAFT_392264 [Cercophora samala]|uniref:Uncharacterized protein n=1 Tax=Cercophora samala TaxID=330535 RepID=A0AA39ZEF9_9PEZI|nr:hypothetical protein QBC41DRAFT_392264 [Cercophora samala]